MVKPAPVEESARVTRSLRSSFRTVKESNISKAIKIEVKEEEKPVLEAGSPSRTRGVKRSVPEVEVEIISPSRHQSSHQHGTRSQKPRLLISLDSTPETPRTRRSSPRPRSTPSPSTATPRSLTDPANINLETLQLFFFYMWIRHKILEERIAGTSPSMEEMDKKEMTAEDKIRRFRSCNIWREADSGTQFQLREITNLPELQPLPGDSEEEKFRKHMELIFRTIFFRIFNKPLTYTTVAQKLRERRLSLSYATFQSHPEAFEEILKDMQYAYKPDPRGPPVGDALSTGAYQINASACRLQKEKTADMPDWEVKLRICKDIMDGVNRKGEGSGMTLLEFLWEVDHGNLEDEVAEMEGGASQLVFEEIKKYHLFGNFLAFQLLLDLLYIPTVSTSLSLENDNWVSHGPGSKSGLGKIFKRLGDFDLLPATRYLNEIQGREWTRIRKQEGAESDDETPPTLPGTTRTLGVVEIEHALCEFSKLHGLLRGRSYPFDYLSSGTQMVITLPNKYTS